eukprot:427274-Ditylum_brightwellii.AAC.1
MELRKLTSSLQSTTTDDKTTMNKCLGLIKFEMRNTLVQYRGKYYAYKGAAKGQVMGDKDVALAIGAYEAAFCADVVASYVFEMTETLVNKNVGGGLLQITTEVWAPTAFQSKFNMLHEGEMKDALDVKWLKHVKAISENQFPFLDMKMSWTEDGQLRFNVLNKKKQAIKYVEKGSTHRP